MSAMASEKYEGALGIVRLFSKQFASTLIPGASSSPYSTIEHAVQQMRRDVSRDWRLKDLALAAGMHPGYFSEQFHHHTGHTLTDFLATLRVDKARRLLEFTTLPVSEVAFSSGFRSISQFNRVFRARTGHAPMDFRKGRCPHGTGT
jgi:transcriptional regulator GlxA family with amidase domain